jgi:hypothetical protein
MLLETAAKHVISIEPSESFDVLCRNIQQPEKVTCLNIAGDQLPAYGNLDYVFSNGNFRDVQVHHRHGYSWTVIGTKPQP